MWMSGLPPWIGYAFVVLVLSGTLVTKGVAFLFKKTLLSWKHAMLFSGMLVVAIIILAPLLPRMLPNEMAAPLVFILPIWGAGLFMQRMAQSASGVPLRQNEVIALVALIVAAWLVLIVVVGIAFIIGATPAGTPFIKL
jgi:hypothetical protein